VPSGSNHSDGPRPGIEWIFWYADDPGNGGASLIKNTPWARMPLALASHGKRAASRYSILITSRGSAERRSALLLSLSPFLFLSSSLDSNRYNDPARYRLKHSSSSLRAGLRRAHVADIAADAVAGACCWRGHLVLLITCHSARVINDSALSSRAPSYLRAAAPFAPAFLSSLFFFFLPLLLFRGRSFPPSGL